MFYENERFLVVCRCGPILLADNMMVTVLREPRIVTILPTAPNLILNGTNGLPNGTFYVLSSTNIALARSQWTRLMTNQCDASGSFSCAIPMASDPASHFYLLQEQ